MAISLSGMSSGLDTDTIIGELVKAYSTKKDNIVKSQTKLEWKQDAWKSLNSKIYSFYSGSLSNLRFSSGYNVKKTTSSSNKATVSASGDAVNGTQSLKVKSLASSGYLTGGIVGKVKDSNGNDTKVTGSTKLSDMGISSGSELTVTVNGKDKNISITDDMTVNSFVAKLKDAGVSASFDENNQRFFISAKKSGKEGDFSITASNSAGTDSLKKLGLMTNSTTDVEKYRKLANMDVSTAVSNAYNSQKKAYTTSDAERTNLEKEVESLKKTNESLSKEAKVAKYKADYAKTYASQGASNTYEADIKAKIDELKGKSNLTDDEKNRLADYELELSAVKEVNVDFMNDTLTAGDREAIANKLDESYNTIDIKIRDNAAKLAEDQAILADNSCAKLEEYVNNKNASIDVDNEALKNRLTEYYTNQRSEAQAMVAYYDVYNNYSSLSNPTEEQTDAYNAAKTALGLDSSTAVKIDGADSVIELNGATFTSNTNNYNINGLTISVNGVTNDDETINITTNTDVDGIYDRVKEFFSNYNALINEMDSLYNAASSKGYEPLTDEEKDAMTDKEIEKWEDKIKDSLLRKDQTLDSVANAMKNAFMKGYQVNGKTYTLSSFGIKTGGYFTTADNTKSAYHIDGDEDDSLVSGNADKLKAAIAADPETFTSFFTQLTQGVYDTLSKKMQGTTLSSAYTVYNDKSMKNEYNDYKKKISTWEDRIEAYEQKYRKQFTAMEKAMATMNSQSSYLSGLFG